MDEVEETQLDGASCGILGCGREERMSIEWLRERVPEFAELPQADCDEVTSFFWLWSFFEANCLRRHANIDVIDALVQGWHENERLHRARFEDGLNYFKDRYFRDGVETVYYPHLHVRERHGEDVDRRVCAVLAGGDQNDGHVMSVLLIVIYRLRNNLVHGEKWAYQLRDQLNNFRHANAILKDAIEMDGRGINPPRDR